MRFLTAGESHGPALLAIIEGLPAGVSIDVDAIDQELALRQRGAGRGGRMKIEKDRVKILSGLRFGRTLGSPVSLMIENRDWVNWQEVMSQTPLPDEPAPLEEPRPGHADLAGVLKYKHADCRNVLERASARETAARVAVGAVAKQFLANFGVQLGSQVLRIGSKSTDKRLISPDEMAEVRASDLHCLDRDAAKEMRSLIDQARSQGESLGGVLEVLAWNVPVGLGSHVHWDRRLDARLAAAVMSIPAIKGVEIGDGFDLAGRLGSKAHDPIYYDEEGGFYRETNHAGGIEGGISNGSPIRLVAAMKPIPTLMSPLPSVNIRTKEAVSASRERSDVCAVPAAAVVAEAVVAWVLAQALVEKFGGDHLEDTLAAYASYRRRLASDVQE
ncbi:MAG: chorismate synthase [Firmicutes bacterium]|nr:chorismate synthase [Bacillota bacterium]